MIGRGPNLKNATAIIALVAALQGAAGVALAAVSAHFENSALLATASQFLLIHAGAGLALASLARSRCGRPRWLTTGALTLQAGVTLFALDLCARVFGSGRLFPYAAPIGGSLTILSWLALAAWALTELAVPQAHSDRDAPRN
jgi:uncharacterized membrane protein YgdD (TMEM256/DUF423 family)